MFDRIAFGPFQLCPAQRALMKGSEPVKLGSRALDILIQLASHAGEVISHRDLLSRVWPGLHVEEANLRVHVAALRKALGDGHDGARYILNLPGRGYCFVAEARAASATDRTTDASPHAAGASEALGVLGLGHQQELTFASLAEAIAGRKLLLVFNDGGALSEDAELLAEQFQAAARQLQLLAPGRTALPMKAEPVH